ncbi:hypothetical protein BT69DRAFT_1347156 [Atractiella rhizophila]|nr:hypothetical protein BT69DRAFT_1347156 [Atractiella rhizophila]
MTQASEDAPGKLGGMKKKPSAASSAGGGKRKKVSKACIFCKRSHMYCNETRPCERCIKREIGHLCRDDPPAPTPAVRAEPLPLPPSHPQATPVGQDFSAYPPNVGGSGNGNAFLPASIPSNSPSAPLFSPATTAGTGAPQPDFPMLSLSPSNPSPMNMQMNLQMNPMMPMLVDGSWGPGGEDGLFGLGLNDFLRSLDEAGGEGSLAGLMDGFLASTPTNLTPAPHQHQQQHQQQQYPPLQQQQFPPIQPAQPQSSLQQQMGQGQGQGQAVGMGVGQHGGGGSGSGLGSGQRTQGSSEGGSVEPVLGGNKSVPSSSFSPSFSSSLLPSLPHIFIVPFRDDNVLTATLIDVDCVNHRTERYLLAAADQKDGSRDERLARVIRAKFEAGLLRPYNHVAGYTRLSKAFSLPAHIFIVDVGEVRWIESNMSLAGRQRTLQTLSEFRPAFRAVAASLTDLDLVFIEEAFERMMLDYDRVFSAMGIPACLWRRTGEIYKGNKEFAELIGVSIDQLRDGRLAVYELMAEESAVNYWEKYGNIAFNASQKAVLTTCVLVNQTTQAQAQAGKKKKKEPVPEALINCCFSFTIRRDSYQIPSMIVGNFAPIT